MNKLTFNDLEQLAARAAEAGALDGKKARARVTVHMGTCGNAAGAVKILDAFKAALSDKQGVILTSSGCAGLCSQEPMATVECLGGEPVRYLKLTPELVERIVAEHIERGNPVEDIAKTGDDAFYSRQTLVALRNRGLIDPEKIDEYIARDGYASLAKALRDLSPAEVIEEVKKSRLRGRGGGGFPTGMKWELCARAEGDKKYIICNADEGDPGAYMDRSIIESDPHAVLEGMLIGARAIGASEGYVYIREEYPLARERLALAIEQARDYGLVGEGILGTDFSFDFHIVQGAGAFVCGEETSLINSIEGEPPEPRQRPPYPANEGLWGKPTNINNVETWATIPRIIILGGDWLASMGTETSKGTKVFSLVGKINNTGLIEVEMGTTLREIIYDIGGGIPDGLEFKAVQTGGPSGGCIPAELLDLPVDYDKLKEAGSIMGSGGMIVMDEDTCVVDVARFFIEFTNDESCGKCASCRDGSTALLEILSRICAGEGRESDIGLMEELCHAIQNASMCGLGQTLPNPVLSTLKYFREEYEAHVREHRCPAGVCKKLIRYVIDADKCRGCGACARDCPAGAISGEKRSPHTIDQEKCTKCGICRERCRGIGFNAVKVE